VSNGAFFTRNKEYFVPLTFLIMDIYYISMREKRLRDKMLHVWLSNKEKEFLSEYSDKSLMTSSEVIRSLIKQLMIQEGIELKEPKLANINIQK